VLSFKRLVLDYILQRLTAEESFKYINAKLRGKYNLEVGLDHFKHIKTELRQDSKKELDHLRKDRFSYMNHLFFERADELKNMQRKLWQIIIDNEADKPDVAIRSISELHKLSNSLCQMYEMLPVLGRLPSDSFAAAIETADKQEVIKLYKDRINNRLIAEGKSKTRLKLRVFELYSKAVKEIRQEVRFRPSSQRAFLDNTYLSVYIDIYIY
jgi:hypothetical protein